LRYRLVFGLIMMIAWVNDCLGLLCDIGFAMCAVCSKPHFDRNVFTLTV
jgi:hypothetical protein